MATVVSPPRDNSAEARIMVEFLARWAPFGAGDEEIFPTFGVDPETFYARVAQHLRADPSLARPANDARELVSYCCRRSESTRPAAS